MTRTLTILATVAALAVSASAASAGTSTVLLYNGHAGLGANAAGAPLHGPTGTATATSQGIIMRDGGICDPIRHMGC